MTPDVNDWNAKIIEEFRANAGRVGGQFKGSPLLLLRSTGAKSGKQRTNPMMYDTVGDDFAVFASKAGADTNPDWYHNLRANPNASIEVGTETIEVTARITENPERGQIWEPWKAKYQSFQEYDDKTDREIPVVILERRG